MNPNLIICASSNPTAASYYRASVEGKSIATWGLAEKSRNLFEAIKTGDAVIFPERDQIKTAGIVLAAFEDTDPLFNVQGHQIGQWHNKTWGEVDDNGQFAKFILIIKTVPFPNIADYREYISIKDGRAWNRDGSGYPHRKDGVFAYRQAWGIIDRILSHK